MAVDTRKVAGRRKVRYRSFDELVADAEALAATEVISLGNWTLGQTLKHLGRGMEGSIEGRPFKVSWKLRLLGRLFLKRRLVYGPFPPGFQLPSTAAARLVPPDTTTPAEGLAALRHGIARLKAETKRVAHPVAGPLTVEEWNHFHLSHAAMHMSFLVPAADRVAAGGAVGSANASRAVREPPPHPNPLPPGEREHV
ncbi:MAG: DUF1569 domain-containing protein [Planctomycetia bacterium]|nr:DUF1569 domain-containing protein [Planctomycetia bacterium]